MYKESQLIATKFNIPVLGSKMIKRTRLLKKLDTCFEYRLTLVIAPAGYGKTTLVTSWLPRKQKRKLITTWLSLDEDDNDPEYFWSYFFMSLYKKMPDITDIKSEGTRFNKLHISHFINTVCKFDGEILMVIDDFNVITNDIILKNMKYLIMNMSLNMHILILSRTFPKFTLARLRAADSILEINQYDLQFTYEETSQFFCKVLGSKLICDKCSEVWKETEGWAAGIQMMMLAIKNFGEKSLNNNFVFEYMMEEVFFNLNENTKKFLIYTSIVDQFSVELGNYLLCINNSSDIINEVEMLNLFLISLDGERKGFRYHNLFRSFLKKQLNKLDIDIIHKLYNRAAEWYETNKQVNKAVYNYTKGENFEKAVELIEKVSSEVLCSGRAKLLGKWSKMIPKDIVITNSRLLMNSAWAASADGKASEVSDYIMMVQNCKSIHSEIKAEIAALVSTNMAELDDIDEVIEECKNVLKDLKPNGFLTQLITFNIAKAYLIKAEVVKAEEYFEKCLKMAMKTNEWYIEIMASKVLLRRQKLSSKYRQAEKKCIELISKLKIDGDIVLPIAGVLYAELSDVYYGWNKLEKSIKAAKEGLNLGLAGEDTWTTAENYFMLAKNYNAMGLHKEYVGTMDKLEQCFNGGRFFDMKLRIESYGAESKLKKGDVIKVSEWMINIESEMKNDMVIIYPEFYIVKIKLYIYEGEIDKARKILGTLEEDAEKYKACALLVKVRILNSMIYEKSGDMSMAISELKKALDLDEEQNMVRTFLNEGKWMKNMLIKLKESIKSYDMSTYIDVLLIGFKPSFKSGTDNIENILSKREIEIIKLICDGATNVEISQKLFVSVNTVKTHLLNIYTKLDVHSRTRAVVKAKKLKLI
ncbi:MULTISPECIES: LuxR C-terminal-related transcriptional regulator [Clostridium]|uniref:LuxR C-terminal-related transcriptional regulator n=1 Tax=Clostridium TaxID=1485 RepID=UPI000824CCA5|nr:MULTISPECIES: LuxR C-terminal-related transcriptional regulator [Clostridium]PJI06814.1 LuxR family transcriptional regulator [Clostridium sp. CT7]